MVTETITQEAFQLSDLTVNEKTVKWCAVSLSDIIEKGKRLEASVFDIEGKNARNIIERGKYPVIYVGGFNGIASSYVCGRFKRIWVPKSDLAIYQPSSIVDINPSPDGFISYLTQTDIDKLRVHKGQILMTCSGTIGKVSYVSDTLDKKIFSHDLLRIDCYDKENIGYLYTYLKSTIGNKILLTNKYGAVITHIEPEHLCTVPIPNAAHEIKEKINDLIIRSYELRDESNQLIDQATTLLIEELHFSDLREFEINLFKKSCGVDTFTVKLSLTDMRFDASYHVPITQAIIEHIQKYAAEVTTIGDERISSNVILPGRFKRIYVEEGNGRVFIGGKQIYELDPTNKKYLSLVHHGDRIAKQLELHEGMILITCSGTIGKVNLVGKHWENWTANQHIIRVIPTSKDISGYIFIYLNSKYGFPLITHYTYGSVIDEIDDNHVRNIPIPILKNQNIQQKINDLALEANEKRYEAYLLEQQALKIMNDEVIFAK